MTDKSHWYNDRPDGSLSLGCTVVGGVLIGFVIGGGIWVIQHLRIVIVP